MQINLINCCLIINKQVGKTIISTSHSDPVACYYLMPAFVASLQRHLSIWLATEYGMGFFSGAFKEHGFSR
jgi:hypothetical protein